MLDYNNFMPKDRFVKNFLLTADYASEDTKKKLSINGVFDVIHAENTPAMHPGLFLVGNIKVYDKNLDSVYIDVKITDEENKSITERDVPRLELTLPNKGNNERSITIIYNIRNVKFDNFGKYRFVVEMLGEKVAETVINIRKTDDQK